MRYYIYCSFDGKIGLRSLVEQMAVRRSSHIRIAEALETKSYFVTKKNYKIPSQISSRLLRNIVLDI